MINLVKKNIIKFIKIISFLFRQINIGDNKINNFWILLKRSLTIWIVPVFLISFMFNQCEIFNRYILLIVVLYTGLIIVNYLKNNPFIFVADRILLVLLSFLICTNNKNITINSLVIILFFGICVVLTTYVILFFSYKKVEKNFILDFSKLACFLELLLAIYVLIFGINNSTVVTVLFFVAADIIYRVLVLSVILNLKKRFSIQ